MRTHVVLVLLVPAALIAACGPLTELEDENIALRARVDSLEILSAECSGQGDLLHERLTVIERENLRLDDENRELRALLAELQHTSSAVETQQNHDASSPLRKPHENAAESHDSGRQSVKEHASSTRDRGIDITAADGMRQQPDYDENITPDLSFLREYQNALSAYNEAQYVNALTRFENLLANGTSNDMIDNCLYWMGETAMQLDRIEPAISLFTRVIGFDGADKIDDALLSRAAAYIRIGRKEEARADLERLLNEHSTSELIGMAKKMLRTL